MRSRAFEALDPRSGWVEEAKMRQARRGKGRGSATGEGQTNLNDEVAVRTEAQVHSAG